jgi:dsDNA-binding SOS-regulon protein
MYEETHKSDSKKIKKIVDNFDKDIENIDTLTELLNESFAVCND